VFVGGMIAGLLLFFQVFRLVIYVPVLRWALDHKKLFLMIPVTVIVLGVTVWLGFERVFGFVPWIVERVGRDPEELRGTPMWTAASETLPGLGREFIPSLE